VSPEYRAVRTQYPTQPMDVRGSESSNFLIWSQARGKFADKVVKRFHDHEVPLSDPKGEHVEPN
jgi:hypothetical protein